ncbi:MAG TPA: transcriptional repressor NrdR [Candidatus Woesearchaeota archaeon]|nr:MAG: transcriptional regulator NrdR [Candidatus Woesearchaeota archaeon]HDD70680.1 transcriptional repressor NrdR [Candidatus Woesearchaeota archaeon]
MQCPYCNSTNTRVIESRTCESNKTIRRRRECNNCSKRFTTYERIELDDLYVNKRDKSKELFSREKLIQGMIKACEKRPVSQEKIRKAADIIEAAIRTKGKTEVKSNYIGKKVMEQLKQLDEVAYLRFASVYKKFRDVKQFAEEIKTLKRR